ncbi:MAG TPA: hypothetical protein VGI74_16575 [Streptosporangiaceae bacterium]
MAAHAEEVRVDPSSDPGRDEYGLPPVDIEIPDDARDLDRDVQAYRRELRVQRRRMRVRRLTRPLTRHGMIIPLVAGCLALTLLSGTLLTLLAGHQATPTPIRTSAAAKDQPSPAHSPLSGPLPHAQMTLLDGKQIPLRTLMLPAVLAWVPTACTCTTALQQLASQAAEAHVGFYLVGTGPAVAQLSGLARAVRQKTSQVLEDATDAINDAYGPSGLTAILADRSAVVGDGDVVRHFSEADPRVVTKLRSLAGASSEPVITEPSQSGDVSPAS